MKKILIVMILSLFPVQALFAQEDVDNKKRIQREENVFVNPSDSELIIKLGGGYAKDPGKFGLDISANYIYNLDPFFVFGVEADFFWVSWDSKLEDVNAGGSANGSLKAETDLYTFPVFFNAQLRLPMIKQKTGIEPFITVGLGWCFMILDYSSEVESDTDFYSGFAWQILLSGSYKISSRSAVEFVGDIGYRSLQPDKDNVEIDMSGFIARLGVRVFI